LKYAVIGSAGQLGRDLCPRLSGDVVALTRDRVDLTKKASLPAALAEIHPDIVVNCAAYNFVDKAETEAENAFAVNAFGVRDLARVCVDIDATLVHFSTDYVFGLDEKRSTPYRENDAPGPVSAYGLSKLAGEYFVRTVCPKHLVIRTCGLYGVWGSGGKGGNFVETMLRVAGQGKPLRVVADQHCTPSYTVDVAAAAVQLIEAGQYGVYHITNGGSCSWHEFAAAIFEITGINANLTAITSKEFGAVAQRPPYSVLAMDAFASLHMVPPRSWTQGLAAYLAERQNKGRTGCP
jgi:dTDP-4-dehydrorhamnose reductase